MRKFHWVTLTLLLMFVTYSCAFSTFHLLPVTGIRIEPNDAVDDAEKAFLSAYSAVVEADRSGANVTELVIRLNQILTLVNQAETARNSSDTEQANELANRAIEDSNSVLTEADQLKYRAAINNFYTRTLFFYLIPAEALVITAVLYYAFKTRRKSARGLKQWVIVFMSALIVFSIVTYVVVTPWPRETFFEMYILGRDRTAEHYYPEDNSSLTVGANVSWFLGISSRMDSVENVLVKVKLGNETTELPSSVNCTPASLPSLFEFERILMKNETWEIPLNWSITDVEKIWNRVYIRELEINNETVQDLRALALNGYNFRFIFELWTLNSTAGTYEFGWVADGERRCAWVQMLFNVTLTA